VTVAPAGHELIGISTIGAAFAVVVPAVVGVVATARVVVTGGADVVGGAVVVAACAFTLGAALGVSPSVAASAWLRAGAAVRGVDVLSPPRTASAMIDTTTTAPIPIPATSRMFHGFAPSVRSKYSVGVISSSSISSGASGGGSLGRGTGRDVIARGRISCELVRAGHSGGDIHDGDGDGSGGNVVDDETSVDVDSLVADAIGAGSGATGTGSGATTGGAAMTGAGGVIVTPSNVDVGGAMPSSGAAGATDDGRTASGAGIGSTIGIISAESDGGIDHDSGVSSVDTGAGAAATGTRATIGSASTDGASTTDGASIGGTVGGRFAYDGIGGGIVPARRVTTGSTVIGMSSSAASVAIGGGNVLPPRTRTGIGGGAACTFVRVPSAARAVVSGSMSIGSSTIGAVTGPTGPVSKGVFSVYSSSSSMTAPRE
jgi:hypothetical protein